MRMDVGKMSYEALYKALSGSKASARSLVRQGANVVLEFELNDGSREPPWDLGISPVTY